MTQPQNELLPCPACHASGEDNVYEMTVYMNVKQIGCVACGLKGPSGSAQDAFDKWQQMPRSSPQVAPGLLRDASLEIFLKDRIKNYDSTIEDLSNNYTGSNQDMKNDARLKGAVAELRWLIGEIKRGHIAPAQGGQPKSMLWTEMSRVADRLNALKYWGLTHWEFTGDRFENLQSGGGEGWAQSSIENACAAVNEGAQGGQVVDRDAIMMLINHFLDADGQPKWNYKVAKPDDVWCTECGWYADSKMSHAEQYPDCPVPVAQRLRGDFNSAVPSAPGCERVKAAWAAFFMCPHPRDNDDSVTEWDRCYIALKNSIDALSTPQGTDSLRWTKELPTTEGWYWRKVHNHAGVVRVKKNYGNGTFYLWEIPTRSIKPRKFIEWAGPITEPAQPVAVAVDTRVIKAAGITDGARLDWLESHNTTWWWQCRIVGALTQEIALRSNANEGYKTAREAIDAAMQPAPAGEAKERGE